MNLVYIVLDHNGKPVKVFSTSTAAEAWIAGRYLPALYTCGPWSVS